MWPLNKIKILFKRIIKYPFKEKFRSKLWRIGRLPGIKLPAYFISEILGGFLVYLSLQKKYGKETIFYICPHHGTGDMYNIGRYFESYIKKENPPKYEFIFRGKSEQKIGELFGISGNTILSDSKTVKMMRFTRFIHPEYINIVQLHHYPFPAESNAYFANFEEYYKEISFAMMFKKVVMNLDDDVRPKQPEFCESKNIDKVFKEKKLIPKKTVILAPYSTSAQILNYDIWEKLVELLQEKGYTVATNCVEGKEFAIAGTVALSFDYKYAKDYVEYAGTFIAARSGLCDIVSSAHCKKIVLTPYWAPSLGWQGTPGKSMRFYGMKNNYGTEDTIEIEYDYDSTEQIPEKTCELVQYTKFDKKEIKLRQNLSPAYNHKVGITLSFSEEFAPFASVTLQSIIAFSNPSNTYDILLLNDGLTQRTKELLKSQFTKLENFTLRFIDCRAIFAGKIFYAEQRGFSHVSYNRIVLPSLLCEFDKIIYLDSDMIVNMDVAELYSINFEGNIIAGVRDLPMIAWASNEDNPEHEYLNDVLKISDYRNYINAGFLMVDIKSFNKYLPFSKILGYAQSMDFRWVDQDVFNKLCDQKILFLPQEYNTITSLRDDAEIIRTSNAPTLIKQMKKALKNPKILHFIGKNFIYINNPPPHLEKYWKIAQDSPFYELIRLRVHVALRG